MTGERVEWEIQNDVTGERVEWRIQNDVTGERVEWGIQNAQTKIVALDFLTDFRNLSLPIALSL